MTWLTWRQLRVPAMVVVLAAATLTVALVLTEPRLSSAYSADVATFIDQLQFERLHRVLYLAGLVVVLSVAPVIGAFWGAPLIARELETGTYRLVWNQSTTRHRWLGMKLAITGGIAVVVAGVLGLALTWWSNPIDRAIAAGHGAGTFSLSKMDPVVFGARGILPIGYAVFGLALGVTVGAVLRRSIAAVALTLVLVGAAELLVPQLLRPHLVTPVSANVVISTENLRGIQLLSGRPGAHGGPLRITVRAGGPGDWGLTNETVDAAGRVVSVLPSWVGDCVGSRIGPPPSGGTTTARAGGRNALEPCFEQLSSAGYRQHVTYISSRSFWSLQVRETAVLLAIAGLLVGFCFWRISRDAA